jgi:hypothetical protein
LAPSARIAGSLEVIRPGRYSSPLAPPHHAAAMPRPLSRLTRRAAAALRAAGALLALAGAACSDPFSVEAQFDTAEAIVTLRALTGTPLELPLALLASPAPQVVRPSSDFVFDLAFDFDATGGARLYPVNLVARPSVVAGRSVGLQKIAGQSYEQVTRAPSGGYESRESLAVAQGDVVVMQAVGHPSCASSFYSSLIFAKLRIEAIDAAARTMTVRVLVDPNCGFRGFESGTPTR